MRLSVIVATALVLLLKGTPGLCQERAACFQAASEGQILRDQHRLLEARDRFRACAQKQCPVSMQADCAGWLDAVEHDTPSIVLSAKDHAGADVMDVEVSLDRGPTHLKLDGRDLPVDPGPHTVRFARPDGQVAELNVLLGVAEKRRTVVAVFEQASRPPPSEPPAIKPERRLRGPLIGASGLVVTVTGLVLALEARSRRTDCAADGGCADLESLDRYNSGTTRLNIGYALLGLGSAASIAGSALWLSDWSGHEPSTPKRSSRLGLRPGGIVFEGSF